MVQLDVHIKMPDGCTLTICDLAGRDGWTIVVPRLTLQCPHGQRGVYEVVVVSGLPVLTPADKERLAEAERRVSDLAEQVKQIEFNRKVDRAVKKAVKK